MEKCIEGDKEGQREEEVEGKGALRLLEREPQRCPYQEGPYEMQCHRQK